MISWVLLAWFTFVCAQPNTVLPRRRAETRYDSPAAPLPSRVALASSPLSLPPNTAAPHLPFFADGGLIYQLLGDRAESAFARDWAIGLGMEVR